MRLNEIKTGKSVADLNIKYTGGSFDCSKRQLTSLQGSPEKVNIDFSCFGNVVTTLHGGPKETGGYYNCSFNRLTDLQGSAQNVGGNFYCHDNKLTTLQGAPKEVGGSFNCTYNQLTTLDGAPEKVGGNFYCYNNQLTSLQWAPKEVAGNFYCTDNSLTNFKDFPLKKMNGEFMFSRNPIKSHVLKLLIIEGVTEFVCSNSLLQGILNDALTKFPTEPKKRVLHAQKRLLDEHENGQELARI